MHCNEKKHHYDKIIHNHYYCCCGGNEDACNGATIQSNLGNPIGAIIAYPAANIPEDYLECNGAEIERNAYAELFEIIGETYGAGDEETTFKLPDLRGEFIRGWDNGRDIDNGRVLGSRQKGSLSTNDKDLTYVNVITLINSDDDRGKMNQRTGLDIPESINDYTGLNYAFIAGTGNASVITNPHGCNFGVTRPRNVAMIYCIKAK